nr:hypothetical protein [uncultured Acetatifactor sp.]
MNSSEFRSWLISVEPLLRSHRNLRLSPVFLSVKAHHLCYSHTSKIWLAA